MTLIELIQSLHLDYKRYREYGCSEWLLEVHADVIRQMERTLRRRGVIANDTWANARICEERIFHMSECEWSRLGEMGRGDKDFT